MSPMKPLRICSSPGCPNLVQSGKCEKHRKQAARQYDATRKGTYHDWYSSARWRKLRERCLSENPLCVECEKEGHVTAGTIADHIIPHKGDYDLFWDFNNLQTLCTMHHNKKTATSDGGYKNRREGEGL